MGAGAIVVFIYILLFYEVSLFMYKLFDNCKREYHYA